MAADLSPTGARRALLLSLMIIWVGFTCLFPILAPLGRDLGFSEFQITSIIAVSSMTVFLVTPVWGRVSDRWGRKRVLLVGLFGFSFGTVLFNGVLTLGMNGTLAGGALLAVLIVARMAHAAVMSAAMPAATAYMADLTTPEERTKGMGAVGAAGNIGAILGPALAGLAVISMLTPLWLIAGLAFLNGVLMWWLLPRRQEPTQQPAAAARLRFTDPRILPFVVVGVLMFSGNGMVQQTMAFRFQDVMELSSADTAAVFGIAMMLAALGSLVAQLAVVQRLAVAPFTLLRLALPLLVLAFVLMAVGDGQWMLTLAMVLQGFGMGLAAPGFMAGASLAVSQEEQGAVAGVSGACPPLGFTIGPLVGGALYQVAPVLPYATAAAVYLLLLAAMGWIGRRVTSPDA